MYLNYQTTNSKHSLKDRASAELELRRRRASIPRIDTETPPAWFHAGQLRAWFSLAAIVCICAGWQSGKTVFLPYWLLREIQRRGPGDYGAFSSTYKLLNRKFLPELKKVFGAYTIFRASDQQFIFTDEGNRLIHGADWNGEPTIIQLGHAENPDSLESATMKAVAWDECGQRLIPKQSFDTVQSRLMVYRGRMCLGSKPYESGWFENLVIGGVSGTRSDVGVISFASWENPENAREDDPYWIPIKAEMPPFRFTMQYEGQFTMPAGLIYDCFNYELNICEDFDVSGLSCYPGMDFGKINTAGIVGADDPSADCIYIIGEYHAGRKRDYPEHVTSMKALTIPKAGGKSLLPGCGGNKHGEDGWREAYRKNGLPLDAPPENNIEVQIQAVYSLMKQGKLKFFRNGASQLIEDVKHYSRRVDADGNVLDAIEDDAKWHLLAALRYLIAKLRPMKPAEPSVPLQVKRWA